MQAPRSPIPVRPRYPKGGPQHLLNAAWAVLQSRASGGALGLGRGDDPISIARSTFGDDAEIAVAVLQRASVTGARLDVPSWAGNLGSTAVADFLVGIQPASAASALAARSVNIEFPDGFTAVRVPFATVVSQGGYVGEGLPIPTAIAPLTSTTLTPRKAGIGVMLSKELAQMGGQTVLTQLLIEAAAITLDTLTFSTTAPGLLAGITPLTSAGTPLADLTQLARAVGNGGSGQAVFVAGTETAAELNLNALIRAEVFPSAGIPNNRVIAFDPRRIIFATLPEPEIEASEETTWHASDTPTDIGLVGSPATVASPAFSSFQSGNIVLRLLVTLAWAVRSATAVAYVDTAWTGP